LKQCWVSSGLASVCRAAHGLHKSAAQGCPAYGSCWKIFEIGRWQGRDDIAALAELIVAQDGLIPRRAIPYTGLRYLAHAVNADEVQDGGHRLRTVQVLWGVQSKEFRVEAPQEFHRPVLDAMTKPLAALALTLMLPLSPYTSDEQSYLNDLHHVYGQLGITFSNDAAMIKTGHDACTALSEGESEDAIGQAILTGAPQLGDLFWAKGIVQVAVVNLCPSQPSKIPEKLP
jgi:hypothetical protein